MTKKAARIVLTLCIVLFMTSAGMLTGAKAAAGPVDYKGRIASDGRIAAVIDDDHNLWMWGGSYGTEPKQIMSDASYVTHGGQQRTLSAAIKTDGTLWIWDEWSGVPQEPVLSDVTNVWVASGSWLALQKDGTLWMYDSTGTEPEQLMTGVASAYIIDNEIAVLTEDGTVWVWYDFDYKGPAEDRKDMDDAAAVMSTGGMGSYKLFQKKDGSLQLGSNTYITDVASFDVSDDRLVVVKTDNTLWEWTQGKGEIAQTMTDVTSASTSSEHTAIVETDGSLWLAGDKEWGMSGLGYNRVWSAPEKVLDDVIYAKASHTSFTSDPEVCSLILAVKSDGSIWAWGNNASGQVGNGGAYDVGDEYNNYVANPTEVKGINMFGGSDSEDAAAEEEKPGDEAAEADNKDDGIAADENAEDEAVVEENTDSESDTELETAVPGDKDAASSKKGSPVPVITGIVVLAAAAAGGAALYKKTKSR